ncbi:uncharacterized protein RCC_02023 [Ramularia collo-cygni]|uniref:Uncharacterized protein n=1 Tax=Ramularia collo-cygni TaxID=112498 RepID=A0A2D3UN86_9PEZI|nr:uncharacterized protein RCC_02023 [Ramularia collo-cygni]CZT16181.1 uncharacterized protein RCC_02023 [Ramularia collo-cygni]
MDDKKNAYFADQAIQAYLKTPQFAADVEKLKSEAQGQQLDFETKERRTYHKLRELLGPEAARLHLNHFREMAWSQPNESKVLLKQSTIDKIYELDRSFKVHGIEVAPCALFDNILDEWREQGAAPFDAENLKKTNMVVLVGEMEEPSEHWSECLARASYLSHTQQRLLWVQLASTLKNANLALQSELIPLQWQGVSEEDQREALEAINAAHFEGMD